MAPSPATAKTERLLNLVIALLHTRQPLTRERLRRAVPDYAQGSAEAFERMFERDKDELRALGVPLRTEPVDPFFGDEEGYRIDAREYALPEIDLAPDELAVLGLAARAWSTATLAGPAAQAMRKLEAAGLVRDESAVAGIEPLLSTREPSFEAVRDAVLNHRELTFDYRRSGSTEPTTRRVQPWGLTSWHGRWYLTGHDLDRDAPRVFRLDRVVDRSTRAARSRGRYAVPDDHDPVAMISAAVGPEGPVVATARLWVRAGTNASLRRGATVLEEATEEDSEAGDVIEVPIRSVHALAEHIAGAGPDVRVQEPAELRDLVVATLQRVRAALDGTPVDHTDHPRTPIEER